MFFDTTINLLSFYSLLSEHALIRAPIYIIINKKNDNKIKNKKKFGEWKICIIIKHW